MNTTTSTQQKSSEIDLERKDDDRLSIPLPNDYYGIKFELTDYYENLLNELGKISGIPLLFKYFMICLSTPRPSGKLDKMRSVLKKIANLLPDVEYTQDKIGNVCLKKDGSKGYENSAGVIIQCHMDMVCTKTDEHKFDFDNDPIEAYIDGKWLRAKNTTLGADDGIGIAAGLALMEHPNLIHPPIELLITIDEETNMSGAINLESSPFLKNKMLINVDEEEGEGICIGCAGGFDKEFIINMSKQIVNNNNNKYKAYKINICGLCGGHTGVDIHIGRANAIQILCRILNYLIFEKKINLQLIDISGGNAMNAIPSYSNCNVTVPISICNQFEEYINEYWLNYIIPEFKDIETEKMQLKIENINNFLFSNTEICDIKSTNILISLMMILPHGVIRMSPSVNNLVQTSISFSMINLKKDSNKAICKLFARSMSMNEMLELNRKINCLITIFDNNDNNDNNIKIEVSDKIGLFPGWEPITKSKVLDICRTAHMALFKKETFVYAIHAGLECGLIKNKYPEMDCISIGPHIKGAHSINEKLEIKSVSTFYNWLIETVTRIAIIP